MTSRIVTLAIWVAAVAGGLAWVLPLLGRSAPVPPQAQVAASALPATSGGADRLLGTPPPAAVAQAAAPAAESRFKLLGVIAPRYVGATGVALISVDGRPPRAILVGHEVDPGTKVLAVAHRRVDLGAAAGAPSITLELSALPEASRGVPGSAAAPGPAPTDSAPAAAPRPRGMPMFGPNASAGNARAPGVPALPLQSPPITLDSPPDAPAAETRQSQQ